MKLRNLSIGTRLGAGFAAVLLVTTLILGLAQRQLSVLQSAQAKQESATRQLALAEQWRGQTQLNLMRALSLAKAGNLPALKVYLTPQVKETSARIGELQKQFEASGLAPDERSLFEQVGVARSSYIGMRDSLFKAMDNGDAAAADRVDKELLPAAQTYLASMTALTERLSTNAENESNASRAQAHHTTLALAALGLLALVEESAAADSLKDQAGRLAGMVAKFRVQANARPNSPVPAATHGANWARF